VVGAACSDLLRMLHAVNNEAQYVSDCAENGPTVRGSPKAVSTDPPMAPNIHIRVDIPAIQISDPKVTHI